MLAKMEEVRRFASEEVFASLQERYSRGRFSPDIWRGMGELGLLGLTVPEEYGGSGGGPRLLAEAAREFSRVGCDFGLTLCWLTHLTLCAKSIQEYGDEDQKRRYLPLLCSGESVGATAISEKGSGAHPAGLETAALKTPDSTYILNGQKVYVTGAPVADLMVAVAVTGGAEGDEKELTAFLVERKMKGVDISGMDLNFLRTAPHGIVTFDDVQLKEKAVLGSRGEGHSKVSKHAFARERSAILASVCGLFAAAANEVANRYRQKYEGFSLEGKEAGSWIHHLSALEVYRRLTGELVEAAFDDIDWWRESIDILIYLGLSYGKWGFWLGDFISESDIETWFPLDIIMSDMKIVLINERLLLKEGQKRYLR